MDIIDFYLGHQRDEQLFSDQGYTLLKKNNIDTASYVGEEPEPEAGLIKFEEPKPEEKQSFANDVIDFVKSAPKDLIVSSVRGITNSVGVVNSLTKLVGVNPDSSYEFIKDKVSNQLKRLDELDKDDPMAAKILGIAGQDATFTYPIYRKFKSVGMPNQYAVPLSFAIGSTLAFEKKDSFFLDTDFIRSLKKITKIPADTPDEEFFDRSVQLIEYAGMGFAFDKLFPILKQLRKMNWQQNAIAVGGGTATGTIADKATADENFNKDEFINKADLSEEAIRATNKAAKKAGDYLRQQGIETNRPDDYDLDPKAL